MSDGFAKNMLLVGSLLAMLPAAAPAQYSPLEMADQSLSPEKGTISAAGVVTLQRPARALRMHVELLGRGKTLPEALGNLKDRRQAALAQLQSLKADKDSIVLGSPSLSNMESAQRRQFEKMVAERMSGRGAKVPKGLKVPPSFTVSATLTAEWPLEGKIPEELLLAAHALQEKVKAADLAGAKDAAKLSPEEEELVEEMAQSGREFGEAPVPAGQPQFVYVARISDKDRDKALAEAFVKAKVEAARLAQAAGTKLGPLAALQGEGRGVNNLQGEYTGRYPPRYMEPPLMRHAVPNSDQAFGEALGTDPDGMTFVFTVNAMFSLGK